MLADGERWLATERVEGLDGARIALDRCRRGLNDGEGEEVVEKAAV